MTLSPTDISSLVQLGGTVGALMFLITAILKGWLVPGNIYRRLEKDRDEWKEIALTSIRAAERGVGVAEQGLSAARRRPPRRTPTVP